MSAPASSSSSAASAPLVRPLTLLLTDAMKRAPNQAAHDIYVGGRSKAEIGTFEAIIARGFSSSFLTVGIDTGYRRIVNLALRKQQDAAAGPAKAAARVSNAKLVNMFKEDEHRIEILNRAALSDAYLAAKKRAPSRSSPVVICVGDDHIEYIRRFEAWMATMHLVSTPERDGKDRRFTQTSEYTVEHEAAVMNVTADWFEEFAKKQLLAVQAGRTARPSSSSRASSFEPPPASSSSSQRASSRANGAAAASSPEDFHNEAVKKSLPTYPDLQSTYFPDAAFDSLEVRNAERVRVNADFGVYEARVLMCMQRMQGGHVQNAMAAGINMEWALLKQRAYFLMMFEDAPVEGVLANTARWQQVTDAMRAQDEGQLDFDDKNERKI